MAHTTYDLLVIGAGAAGSTAASTAASNGARVALVERDKIGGTCLNYGCDPTKTLLHIASLLYRSQHAAPYGLHFSGIDLDWKTTQAYVHQVINTIRGGTSEEASAKLEKQGIEVFTGEASFTSQHEILVTSSDGQRQSISAERCIIASGSQTVIPPIEGLESAGFITNVEAVALSSLPHRLAVIGGGPIGMEFAQMFHRFGVEVTVIEHSPMLLDKEDRELADALCDILCKEGIDARTGVELRRIQRTVQGKRLTIKQNNEDQELDVDEVLLAIGRRPTLEKLNLDAIGVKTSKKGIEVNEQLCTSVPHIWAAGDVVGQYQFTHFAYEQGKLAAQNAFSDKPQPFDSSVVPWVTYTDPALSHVGKTEEQLREEGITYKVGRMKFSEVERAISNGQTEGLVKVLVDTQGHILGAHILGAGADDLLAPLIVAMHTGVPAERIASTMFPYPTLSEGVRWATDRIHSSS